MRCYKVVADLSLYMAVLNAIIKSADSFLGAIATLKVLHGV